MYRRNRDAGTITREETLNFVRAVDSIMGDTTLRRGPNQGEKLALLEAGLTDGQVTEQMLDEAVQEILEAEILRTRKRGTDEKPLRVSGGVISRNLLALSRLAPEATQKFRALIDAAGGIFGLSSARALRMKQAAREGTFDATGHEAFLTKLTGSEWHDAQTGKESATHGSNNTSISDSTSFSLEDHPAGDGGKPSPATFVAKIWNALASHDELFQYGKTTSKDPEDIAEAVSTPGRPVTAVDLGSIIRFSSDFGYINVMEADTPHPFISSMGAESQGREAGGGSQLYAAALDWIHNNGKQIKDDPSGFTSINAIRRTSNFLASALRWNTTRHLNPHEQQNVGDWSDNDDTNLYQLAIREMENVYKAIPETRGWTFDLQSGKFLDSHGTEVQRTERSKLVTASGPGNSGIGLSTLQRAVITASALQTLRRGSSEDIVASSVSHLPSAIRGTSYSLGRVPGRQAANLKAAETAAKEFIGKPLTNLDDGLVASVSNRALHKMKSHSAAVKSSSAETHSFAMANLDSLFEKSIRTHSGPDRANDPNIIAMHRYYSPFSHGDKVLLAKITVKEMARPKDGHRIYSVEALDIVEPTTPAIFSIKEDRPNYTPLPRFEQKLQKRVEELKNSPKE